MNGLLEYPGEECHLPVKVNEDGVEEVNHSDLAFSACIPTADDFYWSIRTQPE